MDNDICAQDKAKRIQAQTPSCLDLMESIRQDLLVIICGNRHSMLTLKEMNLGLVQNFILSCLYRCDWLPNGWSYPLAPLKSNLIPYGPNHRDTRREWRGGGVRGGEGRREKGTYQAGHFKDLEVISQKLNDQGNPRTLAHLTPEVCNFRKTEMESFQKNHSKYS